MNIYAFLPLLSAIFVFGIGLVVFFHDTKSGMYFSFFLHALSLTVWLFGTFMMFMSKGDREMAIYWDRFVYIGVVFIPAFMYHFLLSYTKKPRGVLFYLGYALSGGFLLLSRTRYFVDDLFVYEWGVHAKAQIFHHLFLVYFTSYVVIWFIETYKYYKNLESSILKQQTKYIFIAFLVLFGIGPLAYLPAYGIPLPPIAYPSGVAFTIILAYAVLKHHLFDIKVITTELLTFSIWVILLVRLFLSNNLTEGLINGGMFLVLLIFGILLVRSVLNEVARREEMEVIARELSFANARLKKLDEAKSEFITIASHQLRTPLTAIKGYSSMLLEGSFGELSEKAKKAVDHIFQSSVKVVLLVNEFLNLSRIERGKMDYDLKNFDLKEMAKDVCNDFKTTLKKENKEIDLSFDYDRKREFIVNGDSLKLRQVVSNIIDNAVKYNKPEGFIKVFIHNHRRDGSDRITVEIKDNGLDMSQETMAKLFQKFSRAEDAHKSFTDGTGIGLYVAFEIVTAHNGRIWAESGGVEKGSTFFVELPAGDASLDKGRLGGVSK